MNLVKVRKNETVVVLPYFKNKVLMQLRDFKEGIAFPGNWGFFGGGVKKGETPVEAAKRELFEEISYKPGIVHKLCTNEIPQFKNLILHSYCCPLTIPVESIKLMEGIDLGLFLLKEVMIGQLYSSRRRKTFPVIGLPYIENTIRNLLDYVKTAKMANKRFHQRNKNSYEK